MGRLNLRIFDAMEGPLKPVYLSLGILEAGLGTSLRPGTRLQDQSQDQVQDQSQDQVQDQS